MTSFLERHQVAFYLLAIAAGLAFSGLALGWLEYPALALLLFATFMAIPLEKVRPHWRYLRASLALNFLGVPLIVAVLTLFLNDLEVKTAVVMVLLAPCIDYVVVFTRLAGGNVAAIATSTPFLFLVQMAVIPVALHFVIGGGDVPFPVAPMLQAFIGLIVIPFGLAWAVQQTRAKEKISKVTDDWMVPVMCLTLFVIATVHSPGLGENLPRLIPALVCYVLLIFAAVGLALALGRALNFQRQDRIALMLTTMTRNSLVIMPFALALPEGFSFVPVAIIMQTVVELVALSAVVKIARLPAAKH
ncbi:MULTISPECIES: arsenic resistance protein [unclassified Corynebacterium]|uniref:arsenic resistance protein n=1 Tax=unclassified Corynebacterium TaxID=2624378 RepID=UPI0034CD0CC6